VAALAEPVTYRAGELLLNPVPGFGMTIDEDMVGKHAHR
jgi:hypothetical protein